MHEYSRLKSLQPKSLTLSDAMLGCLLGCLLGGTCQGAHRLPIIEGCEISMTFGTTFRKTLEHAFSYRKQASKRLLFFYVARLCL